MFASTPKRDRFVRLFRDLADEVDIDFREGAPALHRFTEWLAAAAGADALHVRTALLCLDDPETPDPENY